MSWMEKDEGKLLQMSFYFGLAGIVSCLLPLFNRDLSFWDQGKIFFLMGLGIGLLLFSLSIAVLVLRKRDITFETRSRAKRMIIVLAISLVFFFII